MAYKKRKKFDNKIKLFSFSFFLSKDDKLYKILLIFSVFLLLTNFKITVLLLIISSWIINNKIDLRQRQIKALEAI